MKYIFIFFLAFVILAVGGLALSSYYFVEQQQHSFGASTAKSGGDPGGGGAESGPDKISSLDANRSKNLATRRASVVGTISDRSGYVVYVCPAKKYCWAIVVHEATAPPVIWRGATPPRAEIERKLREYSTFLTWAAFSLSDRKVLEDRLTSRAPIKFRGRISKLETGAMVMVSCALTAAR